MGRAERITEYLKTYDSKLYCASSKEGKLCVYRNSTRYESYSLDDDSILTFARPAPHYIFALTEDWSMKTESVDWGLLPIMDRIRSSDLQQRDIVGELEKHYEAQEKSNARDRMNKTEDFLHEFRDSFKNTFKDVNTASLEKKDLRRLNDKKIKGD